MGRKNKLSQMLSVLLVVFSGSQMVRAEAANPTNGILCKFQPADMDEESKTVLLTRDAKGGILWSDQNASDAKPAWYIFSNDSQISFANVSETRAPRMLTLTTGGLGLLAVHIPDKTDDINEASYTGTCSILGEGLY